MRKLLTTSLLVFSFTAFSQRFHLGVFAGTSNYQGDLTDKAYGRYTKPALGLSANYELSDRVSLRSGLSFASVAGNDQYNTVSAKARNLNFASRITELSVLGELNIFNLNNIQWTPYAFGGLAVYHFNPYTFDNAGIKTFLKPLSTEGQDVAGYTTKRYALTQLALPFGGGVKFAVTDNVRIGLELGMRKLFTDHLDDVSTVYADASELLAARGPKAVELSYRGDEVTNGISAYPLKGAQRGGATQKDWYYFTGIHFTFRMGANGNGGRNSKYGCPTQF